MYIRWRSRERDGYWRLTAELAASHRMAGRRSPRVWQHYLASINPEHAQPLPPDQRAWDSTAERRVRFWLRALGTVALLEREMRGASPDAPIDPALGHFAWVAPALDTRVPLPTPAEVAYFLGDNLYHASLVGRLRYGEPSAPQFSDREEAGLLALRHLLNDPAT